MILQSLISISVGIADNIMVGKLGQIAISGVAMANQVSNIIHMLIAGITASIVLLAAQYWGKKDIVMIKYVISIGLKVCLAIGITVATIAFCFPTAVLRIFTNDAAVIAEGAKYLRIISMSYLFLCITNSFIASMRCIENVRVALVISVSTLIVDVGLNYVLIFGHFGFPAMGIEGAATATLIARIIETGIILTYVRFIDKKLMLRFTELLPTNKVLLGDFFKHGFPVMLGDILWGIGGVAQASVIGRLGPSAIASNSIALTLFGFVSVVVYGFGNASSVLIGKTVGAKEYDKVKEYTRTLQIIFVCTGVLTSLSLLGLRDFFISLYAIPPETMEMTRAFVTILCVTVLGTSYHAPCFVGIIRAGGETRFVLKVDLFFVWVVIMPLSTLAAFVFHASPVVVFFFLKCDQLMKWVIAIYKTNNYSWIKNLTREKA